MKRFSTFLTVSVLLVALTLPAHAQDPAEILARAKEVAGGQAWDAVRTMHAASSRSTPGIAPPSPSTRPFAEEHGLKQKYAPPFEALSGWGVGGGVRSAFTRVKVLKLGDVEVAAPVTDIALTAKGAFANPYLAGNVGGGVLKRFDVTFDYGKQRLILEPNASTTRPDTFDRSGTWLNREEAGLEVKDVIAGSPAATAGLKVGDTIVAIDGQSVDKVLLPEVRARFRTAPPGTKVHLAVKSGGEAREVTLVLRDLV